MNKQIFLALGLIIGAAFTAYAIPPSPRLISELQQKGDTAAISRLQNHHTALQSRRQAVTEQRAAQAAARRVANGEQAWGGIELNMAPHGLLILVDFTDKQFTTPKADLDSMINGYNYSRRYTSYDQNWRRITITANGSAAQYFADQSNGAYRPKFDLCGPYTLSHNMAYYGGNDSGGNDKNTAAFVKEACELAHTSGVNFSNYDYDNDGEVDFVYIIYAGYGEADSGEENAIWPHSFWLLDGSRVTLRLDNKLINTYACGNEINAVSNKMDGIGTLVHEFSHVLGLPDLYATNDASHKTLGMWDVLDAGPYNNDGNTPPAYSAYERFVMGWLTPEVLSSARSCVMGEIQTSNRAYMITSTGTSNLKGTNPSPAEFYMLENRQKTGWDTYLPGEGMIITKIKYSFEKWYGNTVNNSASNQGVDLIEADGRAPSYGKSGNLGKATDAYPDGADFYTPYAKYPITDIYMQDGVIYFDFMGGGPSAVEDVIAGSTNLSDIIAVYDISGRLIQSGAIHFDQLHPGMYIGQSASGKSTKFNIR